MKNKLGNLIITEHLESLMLISIEKQIIFGLDNVATIITVEEKIVV